MTIDERISESMMQGAIHLIVFAAFLFLTLVP
jgi:hypothetical protein